MKIIARGVAAALTLVAPFSGMAAPTAHGLRINPIGHRQCGQRAPAVGTLWHINLGIPGGRRHTEVKVIPKTGANDQLIVRLNGKTGPGEGFDAVEISGVCHIGTDGTIITYSENTPIDVTIEFDHPDKMTWPQGGAGEAIRSAEGAPPPGVSCNLNVGDWAWPDDPPTIDLNAPYHLHFTMPGNPDPSNPVTTYYQLHYVSKPANSSICVDPDIINH